MVEDGSVYDVVVFGSGSAGLAAALRTSAAGLTTLVAEKTRHLGGTTALSGAGTWVPANHHAKARGIEDSPALALDYIRAASPEGWAATEEALWQRFVTEAPAMLRFLEERTPLRFDLVPQADPYPGLPGALADGRMLSPRPLRRALARRFAPHLRPPMLPHLHTYAEAVTRDLYHRPLRASFRLLPRLAWRYATGARAQGSALVVGLLRGCLDHGCDVQVETALTALRLESATGRVVGAVIAAGGRTRVVTARQGVVLATGGFEWDRARLARHFPGPVDFVASPSGNSGDGHRAAEAAGAALARMDQANINPGAPIRYDGASQGIALFFHREPNAIVVDRHGRRFFDETLFNFGEILDARDAQRGEPLHLPAWMITDADFLRRAPLIRRSGRIDPAWVRKAGTLGDLAARIGVPAEALTQTVARYNDACRAGADPDFGRKPGTIGMAPICRPPFVALPFNRSFASTKGGPRTDADGRVLRPDDSVIDSLYCAGVAMANPFGTRGIGAGTTIGPNMTWGYICGSHIAGRR